MFQWDLITDRYINEIYSFPITRYEHINDGNTSPLSRNTMEVFELTSKNLLISPLYIHDHYELLISTFSYSLDFSGYIIVDFIAALLQSGLIICEQISRMSSDKEVIVFTNKQVTIISCTLKKIIYIISLFFVNSFRSCSRLSHPENIIFDTDIENFGCYFNLMNSFLSAEIGLLFSSPTHGSISDTILYLMVPSFLIINQPKLLEKFTQVFIQSVIICLEKYPNLLIETGIKISESLLILQPSFHFQHLPPDILLLLEKLIPRVPYLGLQIIREFILKLQPNNNVSILRILAPVLLIVAGNGDIHVEEILHLIVPLLDADCYLVRNLGLSTLTDIFRRKYPGNSCLTKYCIFFEYSPCDLNYVLLDNLSDHILDSNAFVRTRCISLITSLWESGSIPLNKQLYFFEMLVGRIYDSSVLVRKQAFLALYSILRKNPFNSEVLDFQPFQLTLEREMSVLKLIEANYYDKYFQFETVDTVLHPDIEELLQSNDEISMINCDPQDETCLYDKLISEICIGHIGDCIAAFDWLKRHKPTHFVFQSPAIDVALVILRLSIRDLLTLSTMIRINKELQYCKEHIIQRDLQLQKVSFLKSAIRFIDLLHLCLPNALKILRSNLSSDVLSSLTFLMEYIKYKLPDFLTCINPIMSLIWSHHATHREYALKMSVEYFGFSFNKDHSLLSQYISMIQSVSVKIYSHISYMEYFSIERILSSLTQQGKFPSNFFSVLLQSSAQSTYSVSSNFLLNVMMITCMMAKESDMILHDDYELIASTCFTKNLMDLEVARLGCCALNIMCTGHNLSSISFPRLKISHPICRSIQLFISSKLCDPDVDWLRFMFDSQLLALKGSHAPLMLYKSCISNCTANINIMAEERRKIIGISRVFMLIGRVAQMLIILIEDQSSDSPYGSLNSSHIPPDYVLNHGSFEQSYSYFTSSSDVLTEITSKTIFFRYTYLLAHVLQSSTYVDIPTQFNQQSNILISYVLQLQCSAVFALSQLMMLSIQLCEQYIQLIISLMTTHKSQYIRKSCLFVVSDLTMRYPNTLQPWIPYIFKILRDSCAMVRKQAILVLTQLILIDIVKIQGVIAEIAYLIEDENSTIGDIARNFFDSISKDGNKLYNTLPDIISHVLDRDDNKLKIYSIKNILKILFSYIRKEKQVDKLVEKLISRFKSTLDNQQRELIAYSLSLLPHSERTLVYLISQYSALRSTIQNENTKSHFLTISTGIHKHSKILPEMIDLLSQFDDLLLNTEI